MEAKQERLWYIDNLRLMVIVFVVMHHLAVTYGSVGGSWYYTEQRHLDVLSTLWFAFYLSFQQAFFMGLLFLIAGYFAASGYDRRGFGGFLGERFGRLLVPSLVYMLVVTPFMIYVELGRRDALNRKMDFIHGFLGFLSGTGVMWFAVALFIFSAVYGIARLRTRSAAPISAHRGIEPSSLNAAVLIMIVALCAFLIRIVQPIGTDVLNMQLCYFASYIVLFVVGILAFRNDLFARINYRAGKRWLICGIVLGLLTWLGLVIGVSAVPGGVAALRGGLSWESALFSLWEAFVAVAMSAGLIAVFREKLNRQSSLIKALSDDSFTVYMFHPPIIVAVALLFRPVAVLPIVKWALLCILCVPLCFVAAHFVLRKIPLLKKVL